MNLIEIIRQPILSEMLLFEKTFASALCTENSLLSNVNAYVLQKSGKQLRPMLVILSAKMCGEVNQSTIDGALSVELLHTASLIHDDVVDDTLERRGKPSVNARWNNKIAILSGDYMFSKSLNCATMTNNLGILKVISNIIMQLCEGELLQLANTQQTKISEAEYFNVILKKTAMLFSSCTEIGGLSVNANESALDHLRNFGEFLGICFQIKDDIFDYSDNILIGKPTSNDIREDKLTLPLIYALENTKGAAREKVLKLIDNKEYSAKNIQIITRFAHDNGGVAYAEKQMETFKNKAIKELNIFVDSDIKKSLAACAEYSTSRKL